MSIPWCPICEHVTPSEPWCCGVCHEHGCDLCEEVEYRTVEGEHLCLACWEKAPVADLDGPSLMARMDKALERMRKAEAGK